MTLDRQQWMRRLPVVANLILLLLLVEVIGRFAWQFVSPLNEVEVPVKQTAISKTTPPAVNIARQVAGYHLFGRAEVIANSNSPTVAPQTKLNLVLHGVIASSNQEDAVAFIATRGGEEKSYSPGDKLPGGAELREIYEDRVILGHSGRLETLMLQRNELSDKEFVIQENK